MSGEIVTICDAATGSQAKVFVSLGFNCYEFRVPSPAGPLDVLWSVADFSSGQQRPSSSGIPILFPFQKEPMKRKRKKQSPTSSPALNPYRC